MTIEELKSALMSAFPEGRVAVRDLTGTSDHYHAVVGSPRFEGKTRIQQHQLVYRALGEKVGGEVHALMLKTCLPDEFEQAVAAAMNPSLQ